MKKLCLMSFFLLMIGSGVVAAEKARFGLDLGAGLSFGLMGEEREGAANHGEDKVVTFLSTLRGSVHVGGRIRLLHNLTAGVQLGFNMITSGTGDDSETLIDIPVYGLLRYDLGIFGLEAFGGTT
ncbi:hypothetical protein K7I13_13105 [Brucepastera parasyntrophica]|uniref:hypothetical protein n=1 Tax=Brucepastera parasyntrophica TaxID=2880008 RepID=UPI00210BA1DF|nr:hypothetical protein [Brucepastera parasyntrophica]ULQ59401.1 hypothetical protein K7I13_13105 [Brucepastera parasyntrophica]